MTKEHVYQVKDGEDKSVETPPEDKGFGKIVRTSVLYILEGIRTVITPREGWRRALVLLGVFQVRPQYLCTLYTAVQDTNRFLAPSGAQGVAISPCNRKNKSYSDRYLQIQIKQHWRIGKRH